MKQKRLEIRRILAALIAVIMMLAYLPAVYAEQELTDYVIDLSEQGAEIQNGTAPGTVTVNRGGVNSEDIDPSTHRFIFTTNGEVRSNSFGIADSVNADLNVVFRNCRVQADGSEYSSAYNDLGSGRVKLALEGINELRSGNGRWGLRIGPERVYEIRGPGLLSAKGGAPYGNYVDKKYEAAGTLELYSGTLQTGNNNQSNAKIIYYGGSMNVPLKDNAPVRDSSSTELYKVAMDFSDTEAQHYISGDNTVSVNGADITLDENKKAYLYLAEGTEYIFFGKPGDYEFSMEISPVTAGSNPDIIVVGASDLFEVFVKPGSTEAVVECHWGSMYTGSRGIEYKYNGESVPGVIYPTFTLTFEAGEHKKTISRLGRESDYSCRIWGVTLNGDIVYGEWVKFTTKAAYSISVTGGTVIRGTQESDGKYPQGEEITVTADERNDGIFEGWYEDGVKISEVPEYSFTLEGDRNLEARFNTPDDLLVVEQDEGLTVNTEFENSSPKPWTYGIDESDSTLYMRSGAIGNRESTSLVLKVNISKSCRLSFKWKSSSEERYDKLILLLDGEEQDVISGNMADWTEKSLILTAGEHRIEWKYVKDESQSKYSDCGFLKDLQMASMKAYSISVTGGTVTKGMPGADGKYSQGEEIIVTADERNDQIFEGWYEDGVKVSEVPQYSFTLEGDRSLEARFIKLDDFLVVEQEDGVTVKTEFQNSSPKPWIFGMDEPGSALYLRSGVIGNNESTSLVLKMNVSKSYRLSFKWKVSSEESYDELILLLDGEEQEAISGDMADWVEKALSMTAGEHTVEWKYVKDGSENKYSDCGFLKDFRMEPIPDVILYAQPDDPAHGSVTPESGIYPEGGTAKFTAVPAKGYYLQYWQDESGNRLTYEQILRTPVTVSQTYTAVFGVLNQDYSVLIADGSEPLDISTWGSVWMVEPDNSARSGALDKYDKSILRTNITVPEGEQRALFFDWKVSSLSYYEWLELYIDGVRADGITGIESGWSKSGVLLEEGAHLVEWVYSRDTEAMLAEAGPEPEAQLAAERMENCGWIKNILVKTPGLYSVTVNSDAAKGQAGIDWASTPPNADGTYYEGTWINLFAEPEDGYYCKGWKDGNGNLVSQDPYYSFILTSDAEYTAVFGSSSSYLDIVDEGSRGEFNFVPGNGSPWSVEGNTARSGDAQRIPSSMRAQVEVPAGETRLLIFEWKASCDSYNEDHIVFLLDNRNKKGISGVDGGWEQCAFLLTEGTHTLEWGYYADGPYPDGENCGWVRNVSLRAQAEGSISINQVVGGSASIDADGSMPEGSPVWLTAQPDQGYACVGWKDEAGELVSQWPEWMAYVCGNKTYTPVFEKESSSFDMASSRAVINIGAERPEQALIFAAYDKEGTLLSQAVIEDENLYSGRNRIPAPSNFRPGAEDTVKVFVWDGLNSMRPAI